MHLENIVLQSRNPARLMQFWARALDLEPLTSSETLAEGRLRVGDMWLDLCVERHDEPATAGRLHLDLTSRGDQTATVHQLQDAGAAPKDIGQGQSPWVVLGDPDATPFCVLEDRPKLSTTGPLGSLPLHSANPERDAAFWRLASGWVDVDGCAPVSLQHPCGAGPMLELVPQVRPKQGQNLIHLDVRADEGQSQSECVTALLDAGGSRAQHGWGELPWVVLQDPSGNELCVLPAPGES